MALFEFEGMQSFQLFDGISWKVKAFKNITSYTSKEQVKLLCRTGVEFMVKGH